MRESASERSSHARSDCRKLHSCVFSQRYLASAKVSRSAKRRCTCFRAGLMIRFPNIFARCLDACGQFGKNYSAGNECFPNACTPFFDSSDRWQGRPRWAGTHVSRTVAGFQGEAADKEAGCQESAAGRVIGGCGMACRREPNSRPPNSDRPVSTLAWKKEVAPPGYSVSCWATRRSFVRRAGPAAGRQRCCYGSEGAFH